MAAVGNLWVRLGVKDEATKQVNQIFGKLKSSMLSFGAAFAGIKFLKGAIDEGNEFVEQQNALNVLLGDNEKKLESFGKTADKQFGLAQTDVLKYANQLSGVLEITGKDGSDLTDMIINLQKHITDFGSFRQVSNIDEFMSSVVGGLAGNVSRSLKSLGIFLDQTSLQAQIAAGSFTELDIASDASFASLDRGSQALVRYQSFLNQTSKANGDFARTSSTSWENTKKSTMATFKNLQKELGEKILPTLINLFQYLQNNLDSLIKAFIIFGGMIAGFKLGGFIGQMMKGIALLIAWGTAKTFSQTGLGAIAAVPAVLGSVVGAVGGVLAAQGLSIGGGTGSTTKSVDTKHQVINITTSHITGEASINGQPFNQQGGLGAMNQ